VFWSGDAAEDTRKGLLGGGDGRGRRSLNRAGAILAAPKAMIGLLGKRHLRESSNLLKNTLFRDAFSSLIRASFFEQ